MRLLKLIAAGAIAFAAPSIASAQGTLSTQGFGYPPGQMSTRALATGGGLSEFDIDTPLNPSSIALLGEPRLFIQYEPEVRKLTNGNLTSSTSISRFPLLVVLVPAGTRTTFGVSVSTFLDRSSETKTTTTLDVAGEQAPITEVNRVLGAINDVRLAVGYAPNAKFQLGLGGHVFTGQNRDFFSQTFPDTLKFAAISQTTTLAFTGYGVSAGVLIRPSRILGIGLSGLKGAKISARTGGDTTVSSANIPDRLSAGISYEGIPGSSLSAHVTREMWSKLNGLGTSLTTAIDGWDSGVGLEAVGPRLSERQTILRLGARYRTLPFEVAGGTVKEISFGGGLGAQFYRNRAAFDFTLERALRSANASTLDGVRERAFIFSLGLRVRP